MSISQNLDRVLHEIETTAALCHRPLEEISLVAVSKGVSVEKMKQAYAAGIKDFGESKVQEALAKMDTLSLPIRWHFMGKLQRNKVRKVIGRFVLIHSVDTVELAEKISEESARQDCETPILLEVNASGEETKNGLSPEEWEKHFFRVFHLPYLNVQGLMTMAPYRVKAGKIRDCFSQLRRLRDILQNNIQKKLPILSMGMSQDFTMAIQEGATMVRIGSAIFSTA